MRKVVAVCRQRSLSRTPWAIPHDEIRDLQPETFVTADSIHCTPISIRALGAGEVRPKTGVIGSAGRVGANVAAKARGVRKEIARHDTTLLTGASTSSSYEAVRGTKEVGGSTTSSRQPRVSGSTSSDADSL